LVSRPRAAPEIDAPPAISSAIRWTSMFQPPKASSLGLSGPVYSSSGCRGFRDALSKSVKAAAVSGEATSSGATRSDSASG
jgi:hypothetical protein